MPLPNFVDGGWVSSAASSSADVINPATAEILDTVPLTPAAEVDRAVQAAARASESWRRVPPVDRVQSLFRLKTLLDQNREELASCITRECGKTLAESRGEIQRAVENVEVACGIPILLQGEFSEDIASGIDEFMIRQPVGVTTCIAPFNFPAMIPFWFFPYAVACGNTMVVKPSERVPLTMAKVFQLIEQAKFPPGVLSLVNGSRETVDALLDHPRVRSVSFVGSTAVARQVYARAAANGKRVQAQGGAKNPVIILPDADMETTVRIVADSAFGCAGQRCLAASLAVTVGEAAGSFGERITEAARTRLVGNGLDEGVEMGPVISMASKSRIEGFIQRGLDEGARALVDGRDARIPGGERGYFIRPTVLSGLNPAGETARTEIFGPVLGLLNVATVDEAIALVNSGTYGNMACVFTARRLRRQEIQERGRRRQRRDQCRRGGPHGVLPVQRMAAELLRRSACPGKTCGGILYTDQGRGRTLAPRMVPEVLENSEFGIRNSEFGTPSHMERHPMIKIANAPCSWGALEFNLDGNTAAFARVLDEMRDTGYDGTELGDWGFMPTEPAALRNELRPRKLQLLGAFVPVDFSNPAAHATGQAAALKVASLLRAVGGESAFVILADENGKDAGRTRSAGRIQPGQGLDEARWTVFGNGVDRIARAVRDHHGLRTVFHHHCAGFVETPDEVRAFLAHTDPRLVGLCLDTGHYRFGGGDPLAALGEFGGRIWHVHFKDCHPGVAAESRACGWDYFESVRRGVFCELGKGEVDFPAVVDALRAMNYQGWIVVEQDVLPGMGTPKLCADHNRQYLLSLGL